MEGNEKILLNSFLLYIEMNSYIEQDTIIKYMKHEKVIISHGGVRNERMGGRAEGQ